MNKKCIKQINIVVLALVLIFSTNNIVTHATTDENKTLDKNSLSGCIDLGDEGTVTSEVLTFDELIEIIAQDNKISETEAANLIAKQYSDNNHNNKNQKSTNLKSLRSSTFRTVTSRFTVTDVYKPSLKFYCETSECISTWGILKILNVTMNRESVIYNMSVVKQFSGTVYTNLESNSKIHWIVNGDFFNNGTTTVGAGGQIGIGGCLTLSFNISHASNYYEYCYQTGDYTTC